MSTDLSTEIAALVSIQADLATKLVPGNTISAANASGLGQVMVQLRDISRLVTARTPVVPTDPEDRPVYVDGVEQIDPNNFIDTQGQAD